VADAKRTPRNFTIGDKFFLHVRPRKSSIKISNLVARFVGPFEVIHKVNPVAYKLKLPPSLSKIHNVFLYPYSKSMCMILLMYGIWISFK